MHVMMLITELLQLNELQFLWCWCHRT